MRTSTRLAAAVAVAAAWAALSATDAGASSFAATSDCIEHQGFVAGDAAAVAARLPARYTPVLDQASGRPLLFARALGCKAVTLDGRTAPATIASFGVVVDSPDGIGCASAFPALGSVKGDVPPVCNWYVLSWMASDRRVVDWLRTGTPDVPATYVPGLSLALGAFDPAKGGAPFHFSAPPPAPSPFTMDDVGRERPGAIPVRGGYWDDVAQGTVKLSLVPEDLTSGDATGTVRAAHGSEMAKLLGADERPYFEPYSVVAAERWAHLTYYKELLGPPPPGAKLDSFAGSCSVQGSVSFSPPVTNAQQPLAVSYNATGTCTGTLDGRKVSNAPVKLHHAGHSEGSCSSARTTEPGQGYIAFADGTVVPYTFQFTATGTDVDFALHGDRSGSGQGTGNFVTQRTPPDVALQCGGKGASTLPMDMSLTTSTPWISERPAGQVPPPKPGTGRAPAPGERLHLAVSPRTVRAGSRAIFAFRVAIAPRRPVTGALVRFAGRTVRAGRSGKVRIAMTLQRPGRHTARVSKRGFRGARVAIRVRR